MEGQVNTKKRHILVLLLLGAVMLAGCSTPGETRADYLLQGSVQNIINANEIAHGHLFNAVTRMRLDEGF